MSKAIHITTARTMLNSGEPCGYFRLESQRLYPRTPKLYLTAIQFLRRLAQRQVAFLRRMSQNPRLLHLPRQRLRSFPVIMASISEIMLNFAV